MSSLINGLNFLLHNVKDESFCYTKEKKVVKNELKDEIFPYLLVNIGSGVSILKVTGDNEYERVR